MSSLLDLAQGKARMAQTQVDLKAAQLAAEEARRDRVLEQAAQLLGLDSVTAAELREQAEQTDSVIASLAARLQEATAALESAIESHTEEFPS